MAEQAATIHRLTGSLEAAQEMIRAATESAEKWEQRAKANGVAADQAEAERDALRADLEQERENVMALTQRIAYLVTRNRDLEGLSRPEPPR